MNEWFQELRGLIEKRDSGEMTEDEFQDSKKSLWQLQEGLNDFDRRLAKEEARFPQDDSFQMRILEMLDLPFELECGTNLMNT